MDAWPSRKHQGRTAKPVPSSHQGISAILHRHSTWWFLQLRRRNVQRNVQLCCCFTHIARITNYDGDYTNKYGLQQSRYNERVHYDLNRKAGDWYANVWQSNQDNLVFDITRDAGSQQKGHLLTRFQRWVCIAHRLELPNFQAYRSSWASHTSAGAKSATTINEEFRDGPEWC